MPVLAIDLGGTKLAAAVVDEEGAVLRHEKAPVRHQSLAETVEQIGRMAGRLTDANTSAAGLIVPGIYDPRNGTAWAPNLWGREHVPLLAALGDRLGLRIRIESDRAGYVLGEQWLGAARSCRNVVFLAVGTGIGAGILAEGRLVRGAGGIAGSVGWFALNPAMNEWYGRTGCWESEAGGPALARRAGMRSAEEVVGAARAGDARAREAVTNAVEYLAMGIANIISILNPEVVVLGGGLMQAPDLFLEPVRRLVTDWAQPVAREQARIELTALGDRAGLLGAARLALSEEQI
ncbi:MAG: ROK family protein [Bryobacteraceae bacterium]|nr:ROK family protein [Bryobacteraceae bacterium]